MTAPTSPHVLLIDHRPSTTTPSYNTNLEKIAFIDG
jgi:hypothetical protein